MKKKLTRLFSVLLAAVLVFGTLPVSAMGTDVADPPASAVDESAVDESSAVDDAAQPAEQSAEVENVATYASNDAFYKIVHLDCGRKYFSKDWIIALLYEMKNDGYNQLQLAFGNDGLRFLLDDMTFTANGKTYESADVVAKVKAGNKAQNSSGDESYLTQSEMDEILAKANELGIEIVPLLNLPGHANAILDIADDQYNASGYNAWYQTVKSDNTLDVSSDAAKEFAMAIFEKYVDYFAGKGCKFFNFGADEYVNDLGDSPAFSFSRLDSTQYQAFASFINDLAGYVISKNVTPRAFNDGLYYGRGDDTYTMDTAKYKNILSIQCCYWSSGWDSYPVAYANTISDNGHEMINTNGDYYYVLGKNDKFDSDYSYASNFSNSVFMGSTISNPVGSMFCIWCDYPNAETETEVAKKTRLVLRAMAQRMDGQTVDVSESVVPGGFNADGTINVPEDPNKVTITANGNSDNKLMVGSSIEMAASKSVLWSASSDIVQITPAGGINAYSTDVQATVVNVEALAAGAVTITATDPSDNSNTDSVTLNIVEEDVQEINLAINETYTVKDVDGKYDGSLLADDVATVEGKSETQTTYEKVSNVTVNGSTDYYVSTSPNANGVESNKARLTIEYQNGRYYLKNSDGQYIYPDRNKVTVSSSATAVTVNSYNGDFNVYKNGYYLNVTGNSLSSKTSASNLYFYKYPATTTTTSEITFTGKSTGVTYVTIGDTKYKIIVSPDPLEIEYWITNAKVYESDKNSASSAKISAADAYSEEGVAVEKSVPATANTYFNGDTAVSVYYWQTMRLAKDNKQTETNGNDGTSKGETLTHVRYLNSNWQYKTLAGEWKDFQPDDQVVAYYLQKTEVTQEVITFAKDWGYGTSNDTPTNAEGQVALTVAVVYPDGTVSPTEGNLYAQSTTIYNYWKDRDVGIIAPQNNSDYNISKITVTDGTRNGSTDRDYNWTTNATIKWDKTTNEAGKEWYNETTVWDKTKNAGTTPVVNGAASNITWSAKNTAKLILIYLEPVEKETNLNLVYYDRTSEATILSTQVSMKFNQGDPEPNYETALKNAADDVIGTTKDWSGKTSSEANYLPDDAYVVNSNNKKQTFSKEISTVPDVSDKYRSGLYKYDGAKISDDGKTLTLYYVVDASKLSANYVLDFGTPVEIPMSDIVNNSGDLANVTWDGSALQAGELAYNKDAKVLTYTPTKVLNETYALSFTLKFTSGQTQKVTIGVMPASNVLYEENFLTGANGWTKTDTKHETAQQTQKTTDTGKSVFGYDDTYTKKDVTGENGAWKIEDLEPKKLYSPLTTEFYGNTFDLIGNCGPTTGRVMLVFKKANGNYAAIVDIDTRYVKENIYQVPLAHITLGDGTDANYSVSVYASGLAATGTATTPNAVATMSLDDASVENDELLAQVLEENDLTLDEVEYTSISAMDTVSAMDVPNDGVATYAADTGVEHQAGTHVEINGFRVYRTTDKNDAVAQNYPEGEKDVTYTNIIDAVKDEICAYTEGDANKTIDVTKYEAAGGPQNEIYLGENQLVYFQDENLKNQKVQVSLRAVSSEASYNKTSILSNTEMYYEIQADENGKVLIMNTGTTLLAIGNVKLPDTVSKESIQSASEAGNDAVLDALKAVLNTSEEPAEVFTPETFTAKTTSTKVIRNKVVTLKVNVSSDVAYVTVNGVKYTRTGLQSMFQKTRTIRVVNTVPKNQTKTYEIIAYNADGVASEAITVTG